MRRSIVLGLTLFLILGFIGGLIILGAIRRNQDQQERKEIAENFTAAIAEFCKTAPITITPSDAPFPDPAGDGVKYLLLPKSDSLPHPWHNSLPAASQATHRDNLDVLGCVFDHDEPVEKCDYTLSNNKSYTITRVQPITDVVFFDANTLTPLAQISLTGGDPEECPKNIRVNENAVGTVYSGADAEFATFSTALAELSQ